MAIFFGIANCENLYGKDDNDIICANERYEVALCSMEAMAKLVSQLASMEVETHSILGKRDCLEI
jgi:hypothetical protein